MNAYSKYKAYGVNLALLAVLPLVDSLGAASIPTTPDAIFRTPSASAGPTFPLSQGGIEGGLDRSLALPVEIADAGSVLSARGGPWSDSVGSVPRQSWSGPVIEPDGSIALAELQGQALPVDADAGYALDPTADPVRVYFNNFDGTEFFYAGVTGGVIGSGAAESVQQYAGLGPTGNQFGGKFWRNTSTGNPAQVTRLTLSGLPEHRSINLRFLLAIIDSWDGTSGSGAPDYFNVRVNGVSVFSKTFDFQNFSDQGYAPPSGGQLTWGTQRGFNTSHLDAAYDMGLDSIFIGIPHSASILVIDFFASGGGWSGGTDESWAIENLEVLVSSEGPPPAPIPITDGISREFTAFVPADTTPTDAVSREFTVFTEAPVISDAISREFTVFVPVDTTPTDAISREMTAFVVIPIELGTPYEGTLGVGSQLYFRLQTPPNLTVRIALDHASPTAWTQLYASFNKLPDDATAEFVFSNPSQPDQELIIPNTQSGTYYVLVRVTADSNPAASKAFTLVAESLAFGLRSVDPQLIGAGIATIQINGARFTSNTTFALRDPTTGQLYPPVQTDVVDAATALVKFDMTGARLGDYDVIANESGLPESQLSGALEIALATDVRFLNVQLELLSKIRGGSPTDGTVYVTNRGNLDVPVVELLVFTPNDTRVALSAPEVDDAIAQPEATHTNMGFSVLMLNVRPGEKRALRIRLTGSVMYPAHGLIPVAATAIPYTMSEFRDMRLFEVSEGARLGILNDPTMPQELRDIAADPTEWWRAVSNYFDQHGFPQLSQLRDARNPRSLETQIMCGMACFLVCTGIDAATGGLTLPWHLVCHLTCHGICEWCVERGGITCLAPPSCEGHRLKSGELPPLGGIGGDTMCPEVVQSWDPNEKSGVVSFGEQRFVPAAHEVLYQVAFENLPAATAPAAEIKISDTLNANFDLASLRLGRIHFGETTVDVPPGRLCYHTVVDLVVKHGVLVDVNVCVNAATREVLWDLRALDPATMQLPADPTLGFLPPNANPPEGEGYVEFTIKPNASTPTGTVLTNKASIVFDYNNPLETNEVSNTIDAGAPTSSVAALQTQSLTPFVVQWAGQDDAGGSGIGNYAVFVKTDDGAFVPWRSSIGASWDHFGGEVGKTYAFYTVATDNVGNVEATPSQPDSTTRVSGRWVDCLAGPGAQPPSGCGAADLDGDSDVDLKDVAALQLGLVATPPPPP